MGKTQKRTFEWYFANDAEPRAVRRIQDRLIEMSIGATAVVGGWAVTKWDRHAYEVGTWGTGETCGSEKTAEALASSTNA